MNVFKQKASVRQNANQGPPERWRGHFAKRWGIDSFSAFLTTALLSCLLFTGLAQAADHVDCELDWFSPGYSGKLADKLAEAKKLANNYSDTFPPKPKIRTLCHKEWRREFVYILINALEKRLSKRFSQGENRFDDISSLDSKFVDVILKAYGDGKTTAGGEFGILTLPLNGSKKFRPDERISRIEALSLTVRTYEEYCGVISKLDYSFDDYNSAPNWMKIYLAKGKGQGLTSGYLNEGANNFVPNQEVPRYETVVFIDKLINEIQSCSPKTVTISITSTSTGEGEINYGSSQCDNCNIDVSDGKEVTVTAIPKDNNSTFAGWDGSSCLSSSANPVSFTANSNCSVKAIFNKSGTGVLRKKIEQQQREIETLTTDLVNANDNINVLEGELEAAETKIDDLQDKLKTATKDIAGLKLELGQAQDDLEKVNEKLELAEADSKKKAEKIDELEGELATVKAQAAATETALQDEIDQLEIDLQKAKEAQVTQAGQIDTVKKKLEKAKARIEELEQNEKIRKALFNKIPTPSDDSENEKVDVNLSWTSAVPDEVPFTYQVYFGTNNNLIPLTSCKGESLESCVLDGALAYGTRYYWQLEVSYGDITIKGPKWSFKTRANRPPSKPINPIFKNGGVEIDPTTDEVNAKQDLEVSWDASFDDEKDPVLYSVFFYKPGNVKIPVAECQDIDTLKCVILDSYFDDDGNNYYLLVAASDKINPPNPANDQWIFHTNKNEKPAEPTSPSPASGTEKVDSTTDLELGWNGATHDNDGDELKYSVYFGENLPLQPVEGCQNQSKTICPILASKLEKGLNYTWRVDVTDNVNDPVQGEPWSFKTLGNQPPNAPTNPSPESGSEIDSSIDLRLTWDASEDEDGDDVVYQVCYTANDGSGGCESEYHSELSFDILVKKLNPETSYEWWVRAKDDHNPYVESEKWTFVTEAAAVKLTLEAKSGYNNTLLKWKFSNDADNDPDLVYRILRAEANADFDIENPIAEISAPSLTSYDKDAVIAENRRTEYCYRIDAWLNNTSFKHKSNKQCVRVGVTTLELKNIGTSGNTVEVPIYILNGGDLSILTSDIWLEYDSTILSVNDVKINEGDVVADDKYNVTLSGLEDGSDENRKIATFAIEPLEEPPVPLVGEGVFFRVIFDIISNEEELKTPLTLVRDAGNGTNIYDVSGEKIPLDVIGTTFTKSGDRDKKGAIAYVHIGKAYIKGDLNGDGRRQTIDAFTAKSIGVEKRTATAEQNTAGDVNGDNSVNSGDAGMVIHYALNQKWPGDSSSSKTRKRRGLRDGKGTTVVLSVDDITSISGEEVTTTLSVSNSTDLSAMNLIIVYDTNVVEKIVKVKRTGLASKAGLISNYNDAGILRIGLDTQEPINGTGEIVTITLRLVAGGSVKSTPLTIAKANLYDMYGRDFVISVLQRKVEARHGKVILSDIDEPVIEDDIELIPIEDVPDEPNVTVGPYSISGRFADNNDNPIANVTVTVGDKTTVTNEFGYYAVINLVEGEYLVTANKANDDSFVFIDKTCVVGDNENCNLDFVVDTGDNAIVAKYALYGTVLDRDGRPVKDVTIKAGDNITVTDISGYFAFVGLVAGEYLVIARKGAENLGEQTCLTGGDSNCKVVFNTQIDQTPPEPEQAIASCQLYLVHDEGLNDSQFLTISLDGLYTVNLLGPMYYGYDFESIAIDPKTNLIYAVPGDKVVDKSLKGVLHIVDGENGNIFPVGSTGFNEVEDLTFSKDGTLWAWAKGDGLVTIEPMTGMGTLQIPSDLPVEGLTVSENDEGGLIFYGAYGTTLLVYDKDADTLDANCSLPGETEALEMMPNSHQLVIGINNDKSLSLHLFEPETCEVVANADIPTTKNDAEGIALPIEACAK